MAKQLKFEESLTRLGTIVAELERDDTPLAEAMKLYEEGIGLSRNCRKALEEAEMKIMELRRDAGLVRLDESFDDE